ncbi:MAG TPA: sigma-54 dependent transcriptional regulator [Acidobacteriaceae bacterium]|jgi:two-component system response regulator HydG|nr:sigma-54 dependent transcriptional regulator [Acidobacteriaceae bacterium]
MPLSLLSDPAPLHLLVADADPSIRRACCVIAAGEGMVAHEAELTGATRSLLLAKGADIVLVDEAIASGEGAALLDEMQGLRPDVAVVWMTSASTVQQVLEAMRSGASDYLVKPFSAEDLRTVLQRLRGRRQLDVASRGLRERLRSGHGMGSILGQSPEMEKLFRILSRVAQSNHPVLILGESGTGKELVARAVHSNGRSAGKPFVPVDCGSLAPTLIESELFGHVKGAFTGAHRASEGLMVAAGSGTVFLDEIAELPLDLQAKLLRALQEKEVRPLGGSHAIPVRARILAATHQDLNAMVEQGKFRRDLYYRLNVVKLTLPPLRERKEDIPLLAAHFLDRNSRETGRSFRLSAETLAYLVEYAWPGNVRELANAIDRACSSTSREVIEMADMATSIVDAWNQANVSRRSPSVEAGSPGVAVQTLAEQEKTAILSTLEQVNGDKLLAARLLDIGKTTLYRKLKEYGVRP